MTPQPPPRASSTSLPLSDREAADQAHALLVRFGVEIIGELDEAGVAAVFRAYAESGDDAEAFAAAFNSYWTSEAVGLTDDSSVPGEEIVDPEWQPGATKPKVKAGPKPVPTDGGQASYRDRVLEVLTAAGEPAACGHVLARNYELTQGSLSDARFNEAALERGFTELSGSRWPSEASLGDHGRVLFRDGDSGVYELEDGTLVGVSISYGWLRMAAAGETRAAVSESLAFFRATYPPLYREHSDQTQVPITFWMDSRHGPTSRLRMVDSAEWPAITGNYSVDVASELSRLMDPFAEGGFIPGKDGQLLLWQGPPGTGKTWALRALASAWREWAEFHYIADPDAFFVSNPSYMIDVLLHETYEELVVIDDADDPSVVSSQKPDGKWKILILEDTGELLSATAKEQYGQGLSRLLNVVDGMIGQGLRVLALVTTNDELGDLHPAAVRPGRCASQITFGALSPAEAAERMGVDADTVAGPMTIAEIYAQAGDPEDAFAVDDSCANCDHLADEHDDGAGACMVDGCSCSEYAPVEDADEPPAVTAGLDIGAHAGEALLAEVEQAGLTLVASDGRPVERDELVSRLTLAFQDIAVEIPETIVPARAPSPVAPEDEAAPAARASMKPWTAILCPEGSPTDDGRMFAPGAIKLPGEGGRDLPLTLMAMLETQEGHNGARAAGRIDAMWRDGSVIYASGVFNDDEFGQEIAQMVADGVLRGVSVDLAIRKWEIGYRSDLDTMEDGAEAAPDEAEPDVVDLLYGEEDLIFVVTDAVIGAVTVCPFPAFAEATISLSASLVASVQSPAIWTYTAHGRFVVTAEAGFEGTLETLDGPLGVGIQEGPAGVEPIVAAAVVVEAAPLAPPAEWFRNPELEEPTAMIVTDEGRIYGHLAEWGTCHLSFDVCVEPPSSPSGYAYFNLGEIVCDEGETVAAGKITLGTGHANTKLSRASAVEHYDNTGTVVADIVAGEDEHGIWIAGALRSTATPEQVRELRAAPLSGDWRGINGHLELIAALAVNVPGFPVPRVRAMIASGDGGSEVLALVAAGALGHDGTAARFSEKQIAQIEALAAVAAGSFDAEIAELATRALPVS